MTTAPARDTDRKRGRPATAAARILEAAERLLEQGVRFADLPVETVLTEANVSRSSFYAHFADKNALLIALTQSTLSEIAGSGALWWQIGHDQAPQLAADTVLDLIRIYRQHAWLMRAVDEADDQGISAMWRSAREAFAAEIAERVRGEQRQGIVSAAVEVPRIASYVTLLVDRVILEHVQFGNRRDDRKVAAALARMGWLAYYGKLPE